MMPAVDAVRILLALHSPAHHPGSLPHGLPVQSTLLSLQTRIRISRGSSVGPS